MTAIINAAPRAILRGVQDLSGRPPVYEPEALPQHLPHVFLFTERGTGVPQITIGDGLNKLYGAKSFDLRLRAGAGGYATHQTLLATVMSQNANQMLVQRVIPNDAKTARFRLSVDVLDTTGSIYQRNNDGSFALDSYGNNINLPTVARGNWDMTVSGGELPDATSLPTTIPSSPSEGDSWNDTVTNVIQYYRSGAWVTAGSNGSDTGGETKAGDSWVLINSTTPTTGTTIRAVSNDPGVTLNSNWVTTDATIAVKSIAWIVSEIKEDNSNNTTFGQGAVTASSRVGGRLIPIMDFETSSAGAWGNRAGIKFSAPNINSPISFDTRLVKEQLTTLFRMSIVEKENDNVGPQVIETRFGEQYIDFSLNPMAVNERTSQELYLSTLFDASYVDKSSVPPSFGTFSDIHIYQSNISSLMEELYMHERDVLLNEMGWSVSTINDMLPNPDGNGFFVQTSTGNVSAFSGTHPLIAGGLNMTSVPSGSVVKMFNQTTVTENGFYEYVITGSTYTLTKIEADGRYTTNFFTGIAWNAIPYESIRILTGPALTALKGTELKSTNVQYALGGSDGDTSLTNFELLVAQHCENYGDMIVKRNPMGDVHPADVPLDFMDTAKWPQSTIWDTGFSTAVQVPNTVPQQFKNVKTALLVPMGRRKDIWVALSTQDLTSDLNTPAEESSIAITLQNAARMYPESEYYGTKTCRAIVVGHAGMLLSSTWKTLAPMTIDLAAKVATYMGASNGAWKPGANFDISPKNMVTMFRTDSINAAFKAADVRNEDWNNGLIWVQNFDRRSLFYPGIQTVYDDDTSVLNSLFNIIAVCELEKVCERTWRELTGIQTLTVAQFIERSDNLIRSKVSNRFDDKFIIIPETYLTEGDEQRGYSWSCKVNLYAPNMRTVGTYTIVSRRIEDYQP